MKKILTTLGTITLIGGTNTTSLVACDNVTEYTQEKLTKLKEENKINTVNQEIKDNLEWIAPQEKPFNKVDDKWYYVICRGDKTNNWEIVKFKNNFKDNKFKVIKKLKSGELKLLYNTDYGKHLQVGYDISKKWMSNINNNYFKSVYHWNGEEQKSPDLIVDENGNIKIKGK